jgi:uncharacterized membrane protein
MQQTNAIANGSEAAPRLVHANVGEIERAMSALAGAAMLGLAWKRNSKSLAFTGTGLVLRGVSGYCPAYAAMGVDRTDTKQALAGERGIHIREAITIDSPPEAVYRYWRQLERLPEIMPHLEKVEQLDSRRSRWTAKAFDRVPITWEAEIINDVPFETIGWQTLAGEAVQTAGSVTFKPAASGRGTELRVHLQYLPPGGHAAGWFAWLVGQDPAQMTREGLQALKQKLETDPPSRDASAGQAVLDSNPYSTSGSIADRQSSR